MTLHTTDLTLYALFCLRRDTLPAHSGTLGRLTGRSAEQTALDLLQLETAGLVDADNARLTMLGLARAAQLARAAGDSPRRAERRTPAASTRRLVQRIKPPVAAKQERDHEDEQARISAALSA